MTDELTKPTYLYIKHHKSTGLFYFGKTIKNPYTYYGSGKYWKFHIKKYGKNSIETIWVSGPYTSIIKLKTIALSISDEFHIGTDKKLWANLIPENGIDGGGDCRQMLSKEARDRASRTSLQHYNTLHPFQSKEIRDKAHETMIDRYGSISRQLNSPISIQNRNNTNLLKHGNKCAANKNGNLQSKITTQNKITRNEVIILKTLSYIKQYKITDVNWTRQKTEWLNTKIIELHNIPIPVINKSIFTSQQLLRYNLSYEKLNNFLLMILSNITKTSLGNNWFYKSDEFVKEIICKIITKFPIMSGIVLQTFHQYFSTAF